MHDALGDRMKSYEAHETGRRFLPGLPVYARIDGRCFSAFTRGMRRPYDERMCLAMAETSRRLVELTHALIGYTQSDEVSLVFQSDERTPQSGYFFDGKTMKMASVLASLATALFTREVYAGDFDGFEARLPHFDCRVLQLPSREEAANMLLWRELDATKNAVSAAARSVFSHRELQGIGASGMQEMLFQRGINFNDYPAFFKRGTFSRRVRVERTFTPEELEAIPPAHRPARDEVRVRSDVVALDMPPLSRVANRVGALLCGEDPWVRTD